MRLRFGLGERLGPFWAGASLNPHKHFERYDTRQDANLLDSRSSLLGCGLTMLFVGTVITIATALFVGFLVLLL